MKNIYKITHSGTAFGDNLFCAYMVEMLKAEGFRAYLDNEKIENLVPCETVDEKPHDDFTIIEFDCVRRNRTGLDTEEKHTIFTDLILEFKKKTGFSGRLKPILDHIPVVFHEMEVPAYDVVMVTETGYWTPYRNWPYFNELKRIFDDRGISYLDASKEGVTGILLLNYVKRCRIYLGLETGASHYVSSAANGKALILQSGYAPFNYWAGQYDYRSIEMGVTCAPCWLREGCTSHKCMKGIKPEVVFEVVSERLFDDLP